MIDEDTRIESVANDYVLTNDYTRWWSDNDPGFTTRRWKEYRELFAALGSHSISRLGNCFELSPVSAVTSQTEARGDSIVLSKGYAYCQIPPQLLADSLDDMDFETMRDRYRKID